MDLIVPFVFENISPHCADASVTKFTVVGVVDVAVVAGNASPYERDSTMVS